MRLEESLPRPGAMANRLKGKILNEIKELREKGIEGVVLERNRGRSMEVTPDILERAGEFLSQPQKGALESIHDVQERLAIRQYDTLRPFTLEPTSGLKVTQRVRPVSSVAVVGSGDWDEHVPSMFMGALVAAEVAGVPERWAVLGPDSGGGLSPASLHAALLGNPTRVLRGSEIPMLVGLRDGTFGMVPERVVLVGGDRRTRAAHSLLFGATEERYGLVVLCDSDAPAEAVVDALASWVTMDPFSPCAVVTTSRKVVKRLQGFDRPDDPIPSWWDDVDRSPLVHVSRPDEAISMVNAASPKAVMLVGDSFESRDEDVVAEHVFVGLHSGPGILARTGSFLAMGGLGVLEFLRTSGVYNATPQARSRLAGHLNFLESEE